MFSGGLDSVIACHLLMSQGCEVTALHFVLPFESGLGLEHLKVKEFAEYLKVPLKIVEEGEEFLPMVKDPGFGYGKHANPCVDCRIHRVKKAAVIMKEIEALFLATGEVIGQRPMSQRRDSMLSIENHSGLKGYLLRPLSAALLEPTIPEIKGWVDRSRLLGISGRGRKDQVAYAKEFGLKHAQPGGGCLLTEVEIAERFLDLKSRNPDFKLDDFKFLAYGRHFRIKDKLVLIVGRNDSENMVLQKLKDKTSDTLMHMADIQGPLALVRGKLEESDIRICASITARYSKARGDLSANVKIEKNGEERVVSVAPAEDEFCRKIRIPLV
jgi:tRNA U34 2-thiouridine synthase MnmA/TrmU